MGRRPSQSESDQGQLRSGGGRRSDWLIGIALVALVVLLAFLAVYAVVGPGWAIVFLIAVTLVAVMVGSAVTGRSPESQPVPERDGTTRGGVRRPGPVPNGVSRASRSYQASAPFTQKTAPPAKHRSQPPAAPVFYGPDRPVALHLGECTSPLTYVCHGRLPEAFDPSLIELGLSVNGDGLDRAEPLPYWPSYRQANPVQRAVYQRWMIDGRRDPSTPLGYVFIFFYGLERRIFVDARDHARIGKELLRLLEIYGEQSHSFRRYGVSLLWQVIRRAMADQAVRDDLLPRVNAVAGRWTDEAFTLCLSVYHDLERPVPPDLALRAAERDERTSNSVVVRRNREEFELLFFKRYREEFGEGLVLKSGKRSVRVQHRPASAFLGREPDAELTVEVPNCQAISSQFKPLVRLWDACVEDLRGYDRAMRQSDGQELSAEAYEQLPEELRTGDHPEFDQWWAIKSAHVDDSGRSLVPISELAEIKGVEPRQKLTLTQSRKLVASADAMGFAIEPDVRITNRAYRWDERVCLFISEWDERPSGRYLSAATLLRLGMVVAESSGIVEQEELDKITEHLEQQLDLSDIESERLEQLEHLLLQEGARYELLTKGLIDSLSKAQRSAVGAYLVSVAAANGVITDAEYKAVRKLYRRLGLEAEQLDELLSEAVPGDDDPVEIQEAGPRAAGERLPPKPGIRLDRDRLEQVQRQTAEVAQILTDAMRTEENADADGTSESHEPVAAAEPKPAEPPIRFRPESQPSAAGPTVASESPADGSEELDARLRQFVDALLAHERWSRPALRSLADEHGLLLAGAIDEVNEWSEARYGDRLVEEDGGEFCVERALVDDERG